MGIVWSVALAVVCAGVVWVANYAELPSRLDQELIDAREKPQVVKLQDTQKPAEVEPPPPELNTTAVDSLKPEALANNVFEMGYGVGFGSGGMGPAIGGSGGFGGDAAGVVAQGASIDRPVRVLFKTPLDYPSEARSRGVSGYVVLRIYISPGGAVDKIQIDESKPVGVFDQAAMNAIRGWKFEPAVQQGRAIAAYTLQKVRFELN